MLAEGIAEQINSAFMVANGADFIKPSPEEGAREIENLFKIASFYSSKNSPAVIFIDEIDLIAKKRMLGSDSKYEVVNSLLTQISGFDKKHRVIIIYASNFSPNMLEQALIRSGRFDLKIKIDLPNRNDRKKTFEKYLKEYEAEQDIDSLFIDEVVEMIHGPTGADIKLILKEAGMKQLRMNLRS
jgi:cell division protease FtsH